MQVRSLVTYIVLLRLQIDTFSGEIFQSFGAIGISVAGMANLPNFLAFFIRLSS